MCYRCQICKKNVGPRIPRLLHVIYRTVERPQRFARPAVIQTAEKDGQPFRVVSQPPVSLSRKEIAREIPVCEECKARLDEEAVTHAHRIARNPRSPRRTF